MTKQAKTKPAVTEDKKTDSQLLFEINSALEAMKAYKKQLKTAQTELLHRRGDEIQKLLKAKTEPYGVIDLVVGNHTIKVTVKKDIKWCQNKLGALWDEMIRDGANPKDYIGVEYKVNENSFKAWPEELKKEFLPARTVKPGNPSIKIEDEEE